MNQRIQELANKAGAEVKIIHGDILYISKAELDIEKFAELIVRECLLVTKKQYNETLPWGGVEDTIYEHFGVEE